MTQEEFELLKETYIKHLKNYMSETGGLFPHVTIFAENIDKEEDDKPVIIHIPIPDELMENDDSKDKFIEDVMPEVMIEIKKKFIPNGIAWASEAWMRIADRDFDINNDDYTFLPKKEVLFLSIETQNSCDNLIYQINRTGKQVNLQGEFVDRVELTKVDNLLTPEKIGGRFSGLYKKLIKKDD